MIKKAALFLVLIFSLNIIAQTDSITEKDSGAISNEVVSSIEEDTASEKIDSVDEQLLDSLYEIEKEVSSLKTTETKTPMVIEDRKELEVASKEVPVVKSESLKKSLKNNKKPVRLSSVLKKINKFLIPFIIVVILVALLITLIFLFRKQVESGRFLTSTRLSLMDKEVQIACKYMENNYSDFDLDAEKLCKELVTGTAFLEAIFVKELGMSIEDFLRQVRINRARKFLEKDVQKPVYELAEKCGYTDIKQFEVDFQSTTGLSFDDYISTIVK